VRGVLHGWPVLVVVRVSDVRPVQYTGAAAFAAINPNGNQNLPARPSASHDPPGP
jgi:hypothetical protein